MVTVTITEKLWDAVRPSSVKKTGISESIRKNLKNIPKTTPDTPKGFDDAMEALMDLGAALSKGESAVKSAKDDKKGAAAKLKGWREECEKGVSSLTRERAEVGIRQATAEADGMLKTVQKQVEDAIRDADQCVKDIASGKLKDVRVATKQLQEYRNAMRDGLKSTQKDGFKAFINTIKTVMDWRVEPADVPLPPVGKQIKDRLPLLEASSEKARIAVEGLLDGSKKDLDPKVVKLADALIKEYRQLAAFMKAEIPVAKKFGAGASALGAAVKTKIEGGAKMGDLVPYVQRFHDSVQAFEEKTLKEMARGRVNSGDIQKKRIAIREALKKTDLDQYQKFEAMVGDEWNLCMVIYREISEQVSVARRQVERVLRLMGEIDVAAGNEAERLAQALKKDEAALRSRYG